jgi:hypothetical protein
LVGIIADTDYPKSHDFGYKKSLSDFDQTLAFFDAVAGFGQDGCDCARSGCDHDGVHLHRFERNEFLTFFDDIADINIDGDDDRRKRTAHGTTSTRCDWRDHLRLGRRDGSGYAGAA